VRSRIAVRVSGAEARLVMRVDFALDGIRRASDARAPFARALSYRPLSARRSLRLRTRSFLADGRVVTADRFLRACR
jgi:hypothetical protein